MKRVLAVFVVFAIAALAEAAFLAQQGHAEFWWSAIYGFFALYGLLGALAIIAVAKYMLAPRLQRHESYYNKGPSA
jgi:hypothetical protein